MKRIVSDVVIAYNYLPQPIYSLQFSVWADLLQFSTVFFIAQYFELFFQAFKRKRWHNANIKFDKGISLS